MDYEDRLTIVTPEGLDIELALAGLGSRIASAVVDRILQIIVIGGLFLILVLPVTAAGLEMGPAFAAVFFILYFLVEFGYHVAFETMWSGRTPGKRALGVRVLKVDGHPIRFREAAVRALLLLIDGPLTGYALGSISILVSSRNQRVGDIVAGTIVVREAGGGRSIVSGGFEVREELSGTLATWDVSGVTDTDLSTLRAFIARRESLAPEARTRLASELARRVRSRVVGAPEAMGAEAFIEAVVAAKAARR